jgi:Kef-type K+ transport system membrane component KefB
VVGEILAGVLLGPTLFSGEHTDWLFQGHDKPAATPDGKATHVYDLLPLLQSVAWVGLVLFMFIVGYELDGKLIKGREKIAVSISLGSIAVPMLAGSMLGLWLYSRHDGLGDKLPMVLFVGASMSVTAFPVLARILTDRRLHRTRIGGLAIAAAAVDDIVAWSLLAVVVTIAGAGEGGHTETWRVALSPVYLAIMFLVVRRALRWVNDRFVLAGRLTPDLMSIVVALLFLSSFATEWLGVHYIFGAFIMGACMPREGGEELREAILERLEQLSVLVLLPMFFVTSGVKVNLSTVDVGGFVELLAILGVAIGGKFLGAYLGAKSVGVGGRQAGALAALMNTRGLTELIILSVGLELGVLDQELFSLMVVMALVTTIMTGPLLRLIYPPRLVERDIADAERAALAGDAAYRVLVVVETTDDADLVDTAVSIAASHAPAEVLLVRLLERRPADRLEIGSGFGAELLTMTTALGELNALAAASARHGVQVRVHAKFSEDVPADLTRLIVEADPAVLLLDETTSLAAHDLLPGLVRRSSAAPRDATEVAVVLDGEGSDNAVALQIATCLAVGHGLPLVVTAEGRRERGSVADLTRHGVDATIGEPSLTALVVGTMQTERTHLVARARPDDEALGVGDWAGSLTISKAVKGRS